MLFKPEMIKQILAGKKTMTRRMVKVNEGLNKTGFVYQTYERLEGIKIRVKWMLGRKYAVCPGRGKPQVWYCPYCKKIAFKNSSGFMVTTCLCYTEETPLFIKLVSIRKEKLLDITEEDAKKEGFKDTQSEDVDLSAKQNFLDTFQKINKLRTGEFGTLTEDPDVWVLEVKVV